MRTQHYHFNWRGFLPKSGTMAKQIDHKMHFWFLNSNPCNRKSCACLKVQRRSSTKRKKKRKEQRRKEKNKTKKQKKRK
jgi:hypothetical protein